MDIVLKMSGRKKNAKLLLLVCVNFAFIGFMGWITGLEPVTLGTTIRCSNQLSYIHH